MKNKTGMTPQYKNILLISLAGLNAAERAETAETAELFLQTATFLARYAFLLEPASEEADFLKPKNALTWEIHAQNAHVARYLDPKYSMWLSADPALSDYVSKDYNGSSGGIYNPVNLNLYHYGNNNPIRYLDPDGREVDDEGHSTNKFKLFQCFENMFNGFGFRSSQKIKDYNNSEIGQFARKGIDELKNTEWAETKTGQNVIKGLEDAYKKGRIHEQDGYGGMQLGWGCFAHMYIGKGAIERYTSGKGKDALVILAHEGSHYTYATRHGLFSFWWRQYEVEGYRISDTVNLELSGYNWVRGADVRSVEEIEKFLANDSFYKWLPKFPFGFRYWNKKDIGR